MPCIASSRLDFAREEGDGTPVTAASHLMEAK
jgi:hypothetical protein